MGPMKHRETWLEIAMGGTMEKALRVFEKYMVLILLFLMMVAVVATAIELAIVLFTQLPNPPYLALNVPEAIEVFGFFLMVLIGLELLESTRVYLEKHRVHAEVVFLVAIIAVSRKVIILDYSKIAPEMLWGISSIILALGIGYFLVRQAIRESLGS
jgi:uncharacterized membrane protein (DUF373 family)